MRSKLPPWSPGALAQGVPPEDLRLVKTVLRLEDEATGGRAPAPAQQRPSGKSLRSQLLTSWNATKENPAATTGVRAHDLDLAQLARLLPSNQYANLLSGQDPEHIEAIKDVARKTGTVIGFPRHKTQSNFWPQARRGNARGAGNARSNDSRTASTGSMDDEEIFDTVIRNLNERIGDRTPQGRTRVQYAGSDQGHGGSETAEQVFFVFHDGTTLMTTTLEETRLVENAVRRANYLAGRSSS